MGYTLDIKRMVFEDINDMDDDQLYYTHKMLNDDNIVLDYDCKLFLCMNGIISNIVLEMKEMCIKYKNNRQCFVHANGGSCIKGTLNSMSITVLVDGMKYIHINVLIHYVTIIY